MHTTATNRYESRRSISPPPEVARLTANKDKAVKRKGTHHLFVALQLQLTERNVLWLVLLFSVTLTLAVAGLLLACQWLPHVDSSNSPSLLAQVQHRLLLATHNRLAWYFPGPDKMMVLHEGEGVHYGMFPGDPMDGHPNTIWNIIRPHNWRPTTNKEYLVLFDAETGVELRRVQVPSRFSHDAIRMGNHVYVCSTGDGSVLELSYPDLQLVRSMPLFTDKDHPNTLAAADEDGYHLWVLLHNLGDSDLVKVYVGPDQPAHEVSRISGVGVKAHGLVAWGKELLLLDSDNAALVTLDVETGDVYDLWMVPEEGKFLKGLAVLDDIAYFGITTWADRSVRDSPESHGELAAFDLVNNKLLFRRTVETAGLLNIIGAPHLAVDSTYMASYSGSSGPLSGQPDLGSLSGPQPGTAWPMVLPDSFSMVHSVADSLTAAGYPPMPINPTDYWSSGWPRLDMEPKLTEYPEEAGLQLPLFHANITALKGKLLSLPDSVWTKEHQAVSNVIMTGRNANMERFKPGVEGIVLMFSDNDGNVVYEFPYYQVLKEELEPLLLEILGPVDINNIVRLQLARMSPGTSDIKTHQDSGGYAKHGHRIHVPLVTHPLVAFVACPDGDGSAAEIIQGLPAAATAAVAATANGQQASNSGLLEVSMQSSLAASEVSAGSYTASGRRQLLRPQRVNAEQSGLPKPEELPPVEMSAAYYSGEAAGGSADNNLEHSQDTQHLQQRQQQQQQQQEQHLQSEFAQQLDLRKQQQQLHVLRQQKRRPCVKLPTPEGLVFELNNRVPHRVSNPVASGIFRVHLVIDVFEEPRVRTPLPPGTTCEYGSVPTQALQQLQQMASASDGPLDLGLIQQEITALVASPGLTCVGPDGKRIVPLPPVHADHDGARQQEEVVQQLVQDLQERHKHQRPQQQQHAKDLPGYK